MSGRSGKSARLVGTAGSGNGSAGVGKPRIGGRDGVAKGVGLELAGSVDGCCGSGQI